MLGKITEMDHAKEILEILLESHHQAIESSELEKKRLIAKYGSTKKLEKIYTGFSIERVTELLNEKGLFIDISPVINQLKKSGLLKETYEKSKRYYLPYPEVIERGIETLNLQNSTADERFTTPHPTAPRHLDKRQAKLNESALYELDEIERMDLEFNDYLKELIIYRFDEILDFGKNFDVIKLEEYIKSLYPESLYFDSMLSIVQQYGLSDTRIISPDGRLTGSTGYNLAMFGPPGTGKTFTIDDMIRGNSKMNIPPHGLPGRNRYCGGITPVQFMRLGQAYEGRKWNFIIPEFNDWFRYKGMVEPLKLVMEQREVKYETTQGVVGPYKFSSYFSVNYNTTITESGYQSTINDPNFNAIEDRMLCRLHIMTKERYYALEESSAKLELGELNFCHSNKIRDHLTLVYAIQTGHPYIKSKYSEKKILTDRKIYDYFQHETSSIIDGLEKISFSPRLRSRAIKLAASMTLLSFFKSDDQILTIDEGSRKLACKFYKDEIMLRTRS